VEEVRGVRWQVEGEAQAEAGSPVVRVCKEPRGIPLDNRPCTRTRPPR